MFQILELLRDKKQRYKLTVETKQNFKKCSINSKESRKEKKRKDRTNRTQILS